MTDKPSPDHQTNASPEYPNSPRATAAEKLTGGFSFDDIIGMFPQDAFDGFEEEIRRLRSGRWGDASSW